MVQLHQITLSRAQLEAIPEAERRLLVLVAHASNELNVLSRLFHFSAGADPVNQILRQAETAQALILGRLLTGKIYECWRLLQAAFFGAAISRAYVPKMDGEALGALDSLKRYFGGDNVVEMVRNKYAFHYSLDQIDAGYAALEDGDPLEVYLAKANANTFFAFADTIAGRAMLEGINAQDHEAGFGTLIEDTANTVDSLNIVIGSIMATCFKTHLGDLYAGATFVEVEGVPESQEVRIPFFVEIANEG